MHELPSLGSYFEAWSASWPTQIIRTYRNATTWIKRINTIFIRNNELHQQIFTGNFTNMSASKKTDVGKIKIDRELNIPGPIYNKTKALVTENICMNFCNEKIPFYLETDTLGVGFGAGLLHVRDKMICQKVTAPENTMPIAFASKFISHQNPLQ